MIHDSLRNFASIKDLHPLFKKAFDYLNDTDFSIVEDGNYELEGDKLYASISSLRGKGKEFARIETHTRYIDIQAPLLGVEKIGWKAGCDLQEASVSYDEEKDVTFFIDRPTCYTKIYPGEFVVYFPEDGHAPGIGEGLIRKVVVKIAL